MFKSPHISTCRPSARSSVNRAVIAVQERVLLLLPRRRLELAREHVRAHGRQRRTVIEDHVGLDPSPAPVEPRRPDLASLVLDRPPARHRDPRAALVAVDRRLGMRDVPVPAEQLPQYVVCRPDFLHQQQVGVRLLQPRPHPAPERGPDPIHIHRGNRQHGKTLTPGLRSDRCGAARQDVYAGPPARQAGFTPRPTSRRLLSGGIRPVDLHHPGQPYHGVRSVGGRGEERVEGVLAEVLEGLGGDRSGWSIQVSRICSNVPASRDRRARRSG